jgi:hypothetical protein
VVPGKRDVNVSRINKMHPGDWVFFSGGKRLYFGGTIALMWRNKELTTRLWGTDPAGSTWEYMYALSGTRGFDLAIEEIRRLLGWNPNRNIMGISVLGEDESETLQSLLTLDAAVADTEPADPLDEQAAVAAFDGTRAHRPARPARRAGRTQTRSHPCRHRPVRAVRAQPAHAPEVWWPSRPKPSTAWAPTPRTPPPSRASSRSRGARPPTR